MEVFIQLLIQLLPVILPLIKELINKSPAEQRLWAQRFNATGPVGALVGGTLECLAKDDDNAKALKAQLLDGLDQSAENVAAAIAKAVGPVVNK